MIEARLAAIRPQIPLPIMSEESGKPEVITGPDTKPQLAPSPGKSASRKLAHYRRVGSASRNPGSSISKLTARESATDNDSAGSVSSGRKTSAPTGFGGSLSMPVISLE